MLKPMSPIRKLDRSLWRDGEREIYWDKEFRRQKKERENKRQRKKEIERAREQVAAVPPPHIPLDFRVSLWAFHPEKQNKSGTGIWDAAATEDTRLFLNMLIGLSQVSVGLKVKKTERQALVWKTELDIVFSSSGHVPLYRNQGVYISSVLAPGGGKVCRACRRYDRAERCKSINKSHCRVKGTLCVKRMIDFECCFNYMV